MNKCAAMIAVGWCVAGGALAQSFESGTRLPVNPVSATQFEVIEADAAGGAQMWCAAATYAKDVLGQYRKTELSIVSPRGPSVTSAGQKGVVFTTNPADVPVPLSKANSAATDQAGISFAVSMALTFCDEEGEVN